MPKPKKLTHFCESCQTNHTLIDNQWPFWTSKTDDKTGNTIYWCSKGMNCAGCHKIHRKTGVTKGKTDPITFETKWYCSKWFTSHGNGEIDWSQYSTQDVLSGVPFGEERDPIYGPDTEDHSIVHAQQTEALKESLNILAEQEEQDQR